MHFSTVAPFLLAISSSVSALNYRAYSSSNSCSGSNFGCSDNGGVCCGSWPAAYGYSAQFDNLASGTQGQGYTNGGCSSYLFTVYGSGTQCWKSGGGQRATSINWFHSQSRRVKARAEEAPASASAEGKECSPQFFSYQTLDGQDRTIKVSSAQEAEIIAKHFESGNHTALAAFQDYEL
ncbi:MAG: hypothetical protein LQ338_007601 [Usnochroma carphineum]|nr:MAG: hypothetical protein LQ338_007601 [Usnochroma carphineum]